MRVLLDECVPAGLARYLSGHEARTVDEVGRKGLGDGALIRFAEGRFDAIVTVDRAFPDGTPKFATQLAIVLVRVHRNTLKAMLPLVEDLRRELDLAEPGDVRRVGEC